MADQGVLLLSKVIENNDVKALKRFGVDEKHFVTREEKSAFRFIMDHAEQNGGSAPSYEQISANYDIEFYPQVNASYETLTKELKEHWMGLESVRLLRGKVNPHDQDEIEARENWQRIYNEQGPEAAAEWFVEKLKELRQEVNYGQKIGTDLKRDTIKVLDEYRKRKEGKSFKVFKSKFKTINEAIGGYFTGSMYTWFGRSGRGKSIFVLEEAIEAAMQGARVLIWALEMTWFEIFARAYASISARQGLIARTIDGIDYETGFPAKELLTGKLDPEYEKGFETFLATLNEIIPGEIIVRAMDDEGFSNRRVRDLEADIIATNADFVVVDPFYYMDYEQNTSRTAGGDAAHTSEKLRRLCGRLSVCLHTITQAEEVKNDKDEDGNRELKPPTRDDIKKTKAVLEDATNVLGIDSIDGRGIIELEKGRNGGEGTRVEVTFLPNYGIVREIPSVEEFGQKFAESIF